MRVSNKLLVVLVAIGLSTPVLLPLTKPTFYHAHDYTHVTRLTEMHRALVDGHFPVRWSRNLGYGYGMPQFNFYAPLAYYLAEIFYVLGAEAVTAIKWVIALNFVVGFLAMYAAVTMLWGPWAGMLAATAFTYAPYRAVQTYVRGSLAELTALTAAALAVMGLVYWARTGTRIWAGLSAVFLATIILAHNLTAMIIYPFLFVLGLGLLVSSKTGVRINSLKHLCLIFLLSIGLSSFYAIPALAEKQQTKVANLTQGFSDFHHHFLYLRQFINSKWGYGGSIFGLEDGISFEVGKVHLGLLILSGGLFVWLWKKRKLTPTTVWISGVSAAAVLAAMLMTTFKTQQIWETVTVLAFIQFPWRYLAVIVLFVSILIGFLGNKTLLSTGRRILVVIMIGLVVGFNLQYFHPKGYLTNDDAYYYTSDALIQAEMSEIIPDFLPLLAPNSPVPPPENRVALASPADGSIELRVDRVHEFLAKVTLDRPTRLTINIFEFPGWQLYVNGQPVTHQVDTTGGFMTLNLDKGEQEVSGKFENTPIRSLANVVSMLSLLLTGYLILLERRYATKPH